MALSVPLRLHAFLPVSRANGPGRRSVVWVQGCSRRCAGCFNPETHSFIGGRQTTVEAVFRAIVELGDAVQGVTVSGGEPLEQAEAVSALLGHIRSATRLSTLLFTGNWWDEFLSHGAAPSLLGSLDLVVAGPYDARCPSRDGLRGSENQTIHFVTDRYGPADLAAVPACELILTPDGDVVTSGIRPIEIPPAVGSPRGGKHGF